jgi:hypothetical protein
MEKWSIGMAELQDEGLLFGKVAKLIRGRHEVAAMLESNIRRVERRAQEHFNIIAKLMRCPEAA